MSVIQIPNNWSPREYQLPAWEYLESGGKRAALVCHRRWGKDDLALHWTCVAAHQRPATYWHMLPQYAQGRKAIWEAVNPHTGQRRIDEAFPQELRSRTDSQTMTIQLKCGSMWHVVGSDNYNALVGSPPAGIVFSEWALADPAAWAYLRPILDENDGWALFIYTSRGRNHGYSVYQRAKKEPDWFGQRSTAKDTPVFSDKQLESARSELIDIYGVDHGEALYQQEYFCSFEAAVLGAYYGREMSKLEDEGRITDVKHDSYANVITAWDLGISDSTAIWFIQPVGSEFHVIDYYENSGVGLDHYAEVVLKKPYAYERHIVPHDAQARELGTGKSRLEILEKLGIKATVAPNLKIADGINAARKILPKCYFDSSCDKGIEALRMYRREYDDKKKDFRDAPLHDWTSHAADAFRYFAIGYVEHKTMKPIDYPKLGIV